jgi:hypothetical protein
MSQQSAKKPETQSLRCPSEKLQQKELEKTKRGKSGSGRRTVTPDLSNGSLP